MYLLMKAEYSVYLNGNYKSIRHFARECDSGYSHVTLTRWFKNFT